MIETTDSKHSRFSRIVEWTLVAMASIAIVVVVIMRAIRVPLTYDESYSLSIALGQAGPTIANNHWLNTALMKLVLEFGGTLDAAIRIPNVMAGIVYVLCVISISRHLGSWQGGSIFFAISALNPFVIEFFSIGRGYGLSLGFMALSLCLMLGITKTKEGNQIVLKGIGALASLTLAFYSSFGTFVLILIMGLSTVVLTWLRWSRTRPFGLESAAKRSVLFTAVVAFLSFLLALVPGVIELFQLRKLDLLYYGGGNDFFSDSIRSFSFGVLRSSGIQDLLLLEIWSWAVLIIGTTTILVLLNHAMRSGSAFEAFLVSALIGFPLAHTMLNLLLGINFPIGRTLIPTLIVFALGVAVAFDIASSRLTGTLPKSFFSAAVIGALLSSVYLITSWANVTHTSEWRYDAGSRDVALLVSKEIELNKGLVICPADITASNSLVAVTAYLNLWDVPLPVVNCDDGGARPGHDISISFPEGLSGINADYLNKVSGVEVQIHLR